ncbi:hypothetical protein ESCO_005881 [Escovopsis weberi]|uniref:Ribosome biogenesis protein Alb1 n=1 Tax=Escovopsis weberi TaxID=150374 RepID=A0A0M8MS01_ESCWE|nr:hypothetical protein ESCO_005881 [Escovopsis weberi]
MAGRRAPSKHSRASRRATSPSIDTDKSLKDVSLPRAGDVDDTPGRRSTTLQPSVLAARHFAGVTKKTAKGRKSRPSARAKKRAEKGLEMAEAVLERTGKKVEKSLGRARVVKARRREWRDINKTAGEKAENAPANDDDGDEEEDDDDDNEIDEDMAGGGAVAAAAVATRFGDEDEEIL